MYICISPISKLFKKIISLDYIPLTDQSLDMVTGAEGGAYMDGECQDLGGFSGRI